MTIAVVVLMCSMVNAQEVDSAATPRKKVAVVLSGGGAKVWHILAC